MFFQVARRTDDRIRYKMRQVRSNREHSIVVIGVHDLNNAADLLPHFNNLGDSVLVGGQWRRNDTIAAFVELWKACLGT